MGLSQSAEVFEGGTYGYHVHGVSCCKVLSYLEQCGTLRRLICSCHCMLTRG